MVDIPRLEKAASPSPNPFVEQGAQRAQAQANDAGEAHRERPDGPAGMGREATPSMDPGRMDGEVAAANTAIQTQQVITGLANLVKERWSAMTMHKRSEVDHRLVACLDARNERYSAEKLAAIKALGGSEQYIGVVSEKCRATTAWLSDALLGQGDEKPWTVEPTPVPELSPDDEKLFMEAFQQKVAGLYADMQDPVTGHISRFSEDELHILMESMRATFMRDRRELAEMRVAALSREMEDRLVEGGFAKALHEFIMDIATFPFAVLKGPVPKRKVTMGVMPDGRVGPREAIVQTFECVSPFKFFWAPWAENVQDGPIIEQHYLAKSQLEALLGTPGYNDVAIRHVLSGMATNTGGLVDMTRGGIVDQARETDLSQAGGDVVMALQLWDMVPGRLLREWGLEGGIDPQRSYACEVWMVEDTVIKAVLNPDPTGHKPYYVTSFEKQNQAIMGKGVADIVMFAQDMINACARNLANNMAWASGPQVVVDVSKLVNGQDMTTLHPGKIWQRRAADFGGDGALVKPIEFFHPDSHAEENMRVIQMWQAAADDKSGVPRYMAGAHQPGATRTSTGLSMLMANAGRGLKQVLGNIDADVLKPLVQRLHRDILVEGGPEMVRELGDVQIHARGARSLMTKETEEIRKSEILNMILKDPTLLNLVKDEGVASLLADQLKSISAGAENIVPPREEIIQERLAREAVLLRAAAEQGMNPGLEQAPGAPPLPAPAGGGPGADGNGDYKPPNEQADGTKQGGRNANTTSSRVGEK